MFSPVSQPSGGWQSSRVGERSHISAGCLTTAASLLGTDFPARRNDSRTPGRRRTKRAVTDEMVLALSATGTPDDIALRLDALLQAGLKQAVLFPLSTDGDAKSAILRTIEFLRTGPI